MASTQTGAAADVAMEAAPEAHFTTAVQLMSGAQVSLPVKLKAPLFVVGPNGAGKSGLVQRLYQSNHATSVRISAHRQNWMQTNYVPFSPQEKVNSENTIKSQDVQPTGRYSEWNPALRAGIVVADLIDADNALARKVRELLTKGDAEGANAAAASPSPLETINTLLAGSGIPIVLAIAENSAITASKRGGPPYSIAALSDGERSALLTAGTVLTAKKGSLILIDEPERHLHASIVTPLLLQLFSLRPDCAFVISTHELSLPGSSPESRTVIVRDSAVNAQDVTSWDVDILDAGIDIDEQTKLSILGSRRTVIFVEGTLASLDKPLYEILFPGTSIAPRETCGEVERSVDSIRSAALLAWVRAYGIVDQDQLSEGRKAVLQSKNTYALGVYSVESLYYHPQTIARVAVLQGALTDMDPASLVAAAQDGIIKAVATSEERMAARMSEQVVKDQASLQMLDWKRILAGENVTITVDAQAALIAEKARLAGYLAARDVASIVGRYPIRETGALEAVVKALSLRDRATYEAVVRKLIKDDASARAEMLAHFGALASALA